MKNLYLTAVLCTCTLTPFAQPTYQMETVGTPASPCAVSSYTGWTNNGLLSFSGNAEVQNANTSNNMNASGAGNVYFTNVPGTSMTISGFSATLPPQSLDLTFGMYGYNVSNLSELVLEYTTDGINYTPLSYKRLFRQYLPPTPWDVMVSDPLPGTTDLSTLQIRFRQTSSTQTFRIDDIEANFYYTLPIKLISFSGIQRKGVNELSWTANSTDEQEFFVVEKSTDGRKFTAIANIKVAGTGDHSYAFSDRTPGKTFYRLKLMDVSGRSSYSQIIYLDNIAAGNGLIHKIYPIPATDVVNTQVNSALAEKASITITDMSGRVVSVNAYTLSQGFNNCAVNTSRLQPGMYTLKIVTGTTTESKSIIIQ